MIEIVIKEIGNGWVVEISDPCISGVETMYFETIEKVFGCIMRHVPTKRYCGEKSIEGTQNG